MQIETTISVADMLAFAVGAGGVALGLLNWLQQRSETAPVVEVALLEHEPAYSRVGVSLRSRKDAAYRITAARILRPRGARIVPFSAAMEADGGGGFAWPDAFPHALARRETALSVYVPPHGMGHNSLLLFVPGPPDSREIAISIRVTAEESSSSSRRRRFARTIRARTNTPSATTASA